MEMNEAHSTRAKELVTELVALSTRLEDAGGPEEDGDLFERVLVAEDSLLEHFALPLTDENRTLLEAAESPLDENGVGELIATLARAAEEHERLPRNSDSEGAVRYELRGRDSFDREADVYVVGGYRTKKSAIDAAKKRAEFCRSRVSGDGDPRYMEDRTVLIDLQTGDCIWDSRKDYLPAEVNGRRE